MWFMQLTRGSKRGHCRVWHRHKPHARSGGSLWLTPRNVVENHGKLVDFCGDIKSCLASLQRMFVDKASDGSGFEEGEGRRGIQIHWPEFPTILQAALGTDRHSGLTWSFSAASGSRPKHGWHLRIYPVFLPISCKVAIKWRKGKLLFSLTRLQRYYSFYMLGGQKPEVN